MYCTNCGSGSVIKRGRRPLQDGSYTQRYQCNDCGKNFGVRNDSSTHSFKRFIPDTIFTEKRYVITSAQNNTETNEAFLGALENYCQMKGARLLIYPLMYQKNLYEELVWTVPNEYMMEEKVSLNNKVNIMAHNTNPAADNPIGGLDHLAKGNSLIIPHNQIAMRSLPVQRNEAPSIIHTTGTVSKPNYTNSKAGAKADFNHSYAAIVVEFESDGSFHLRILNGDENDGFYDVDGYYTEDSFEPIEYTEALITGDEHVMFIDDGVSKATYTAKDSIVNTLKPKVIVRHDVIDCFTISHHHRKDNFLKYSKYINNMNKIEDELKETIEYVINTTPDFAQTVIVSSNHHDHLKRWLNESDPSTEPWNAKIYHYLQYQMLDAIEAHSANETDRLKKIHVPDTFELYCEHEYPGKIKFVGRNEDFKVHGIELSNHGDIGANGARGTLNQFSRFSEKTVTGHAHTPGIMKGAYGVGVSTPKNLEYTNGPSSWCNTHCIIYPNGKRQLIFIIKGKWRLVDK